MKHWIGAALICLCSLAASVAHAAPYFRVLHPLDEVRTGAFIKMGTPNDNVAFGFQTTLIKHYASDGYLFIEGVSWSLFDIGAAKTEHGDLDLVVGPSIDLSEPLKAAVLRGLDAALPDGFSGVKALLQPSQEGKPSVAVSVGPGFQFSTADSRGSLVMHAGLSAKF